MSNHDGCVALWSVGKAIFSKLKSNKGSRVVHRVCVIKANTTELAFRNRMLVILFT